MAYDIPDKTTHPQESATGPAEPAPGLAELAPGQAEPAPSPAQPAPGPAQPAPEVSEQSSDEETGASPGTAQACNDLGLNSLAANLDRFGIKPPGES